MFVGHFAMPFLLLYFLLNTYTELDQSRIIIFCIVSGIYGLVADLDILFAFVEAILFIVNTGNISIDKFWDISRTFHRQSTHSLFVGFLSIIGIVIQSTYISDITKPYENILFDYIISIGCGLMMGFMINDFARGILVSGLFVFCVLSITRLIRFQISFNKRVVFMSAVIGILSHPFGDIFTGTPPEFFYPIYQISLERIVLFANETLNLSVLFLFENFLVVVLILLYANAKNIKINMIRSTLLAAVISGIIISYVIPSPSINDPYQFVSGILVLTIAYIFITSYKKDIRYLLKAPIVSLIICIGYILGFAIQLLTQLF